MGRREGRKVMRGWWDVPRYPFHLGNYQHSSDHFGHLREIHTLVVCRKGEYLTGKLLRLHGKAVCEDGNGLAASSESKPKLTLRKICQNPCACTPRNTIFLPPQHRALPSTA